MDSYVTIRFINERGFVTWAISRVTNSLFSHVEFGTPEGTWIGAHSNGGVQERPGDYCKPSREYVYRIPCKREQSESLLKSIRGAIGTPYNFKDIVGLLFHARTLTTKNRVICSQFCFIELCKVGIRALNVLPDYSHLVTPETLHLSPLLIGRMVKKVGQ